MLPCAGDARPVPFEEAPSVSAGSISDLRAESRGPGAGTRGDADDFMGSGSDATPLLLRRWPPRGAVGCLAGPRPGALPPGRGRCKARARGCRRDGAGSGRRGCSTERPSGIRRCSEGPAGLSHCGSRAGSGGQMATRRRRRWRLRKRTRRQLQGWGIVAAVVAAVWLPGNWTAVWPVLVAGVGWGLWSAHQDAVGQDRKWRAQEVLFFGSYGVAERSRASIGESRDARMRCGVPRSDSRCSPKGWRCIRCWRRVVAIRRKGGVR